LKPHALGVLLAGGRGTRLAAGVPKALVECAGRTLLERASELLVRMCDELVVVAPEAMALPVSARNRVADPPGGFGPLAALVAGLHARDHAEALVLAVDMPLLGADALARLRASRGDALAVVARPNGVAQPLAAWYSMEARDTLATALREGERSVIAAVERLSPKWVEDDTLIGWPGGRGAWSNVNTREELAMAEASLKVERR